MAWYRTGGGGSAAEDGNNIIYPIADPTSENKLYSEEDINDIALALGQSLTVAEMADAVRSNTGGLNATRLIIHSESYTEVIS